MIRPLAVLVLLAPLSACLGPESEMVQGAGIEWNAQVLELGAVEHSGGGVSTFEDSPERERNGMQVEFGSRVAAATVEVFQEDWTYAGFESYTLNGVGVGARGQQYVGEFDATEISLVMPWRVGASFALGTTRSGGLIDELGYRELRGELGLGLHWNGLRLSLGAALSAVDGSGTFDSPQFGTGPASVRQLDVTGENLGLYLEARYEPPTLPIHGLLRASGADETGTLFGLGMRF